ncbi:MAG: prenyltransferase [Conexivisphaerales archaeon]
MSQNADELKRYIASSTKRVTMISKLQSWVNEALEPSLLISVLLVSLGAAFSWYQGSFNLLLVSVTMIAAVLIQISVNVLNDYFDFMNGVDVHTEKTPFSGGSKLLVQGVLKPVHVYQLGLASLFVALAIGVYLAFARTLLLIPLIAEAALSTYIYTPFLARHYLGEFFTGLNLGPLSLLGTYMVLTTRLSLAPLAVGIVPGIMIANVLLMNEIPDIDADSKGGRRNIATFLGREKASIFSFYLGLIAYIILVPLLTFRVLPSTALLAFLSLPLFIKAGLGVLKHNSSAREIAPYLGLNIISTLLVMLLLSASFYLARVV